MGLTTRPRVLRRLVGADHQLTKTLPPDVVAEGVRRLGWLGLIYAIAISIGSIGKAVIVSADGGIAAMRFGVPDAFGLVAVAMGLALYGVVRKGVVSSQRVLDAGLVFLVVGTLGISVREFWSGLPPVAQVLLFVPAECVWLMAYPLFVPNTPLKIAIASLVAASTGPVVLAVSAAMSGIGPDPSYKTAVYFATSTYLCAAGAYAIARIVHRVNMRLKDAREIGSYSLIEPIGRGGMGEVWRAEHRLLARPAAVKLIRSDFLGETLLDRDTLVRRFEREARATAALRSVHTVDVYDFGLTEQGDFYYVMELLEGLSFQQLVDGFGPVSPARAVYLLQQVCHSLAEAHGHGLVHRDIKPANLFACRLGPDVDFVKVLDFGLVKHNPADVTLTLLSMDGTVTGTPAYMAPEVALGRPNVDGRADIYSLGCVGYFLLTGQPVFSGDTLIGTAMAHVQETPVPPSRRTPVEIPPKLETLILNCLAKDPEARPPSAATVSTHLASLTECRWSPTSASMWWQNYQRMSA